MDDHLRGQLAAADTLREALYEYGVDDDDGRFQSARALAWQQFFGPLVPLGQLPDDHPDWDAYDDWFLFDYRLADGGKTAFGLFLDQRADVLPAEQQALAESWRHDRLGIFAVEWTGSGTGAILRDLKDGAQFTVPNLPLSRRGVRWDHLIGRLVPIGELWGFAAPPRHLLPSLTERLPADFVGAEPPAADLRARAIEFWRAVRRIAAEAPRVPMTEEGDPVQPSSAAYRVANPAGVAAALRAQRALERAEDAPTGEEWLVWRGLPPGLSTREGASRVDLAIVRLAGEIVTIESLTPRRLARARIRFEPLLGQFEHLGDQSEASSAAPPSAEALARERAAGLLVGAVLQAVAADRRYDALGQAAPGSEAAVLLEQFDREPFGVLAGLHHRGRIGLSDVQIRDGVAGVELSYEQPGEPTRYSQARVRERADGWEIEAIRPGRLGQSPAEAATGPELAALWSGDWQWAPVGSAGNHPVLGIALKRLHLAKRQVLVQVLAVRLWQDFVARSAPGPAFDDETWAIALETAADWIAGLAGKPDSLPARRIADTLQLADADPRYAIDTPVFA